MSTQEHQEIPIYYLPIIKVMKIDSFVANQSAIFPLLREYMCL